LANGLATAVLIGMGLAVLYVIVLLVQATTAETVPASDQPAWQQQAIAFLSLLGLGVAAYLTYVKLTHTEAYCGPVGDCYAVQMSRYSELFGVPVAVLGGLTYLVVLALWSLERYGKGSLQELAPLGRFGLTLVGTLFSIYLTFLEPFVIGKVCIWCLTSAVTITLLLLLSVKPALSSIAVGGEE